MIHAAFLATLGAVSAVLLWWGVRTLPHENRQILAAIPRGKHAHGGWKGMNLTYYGLITATANALAVALVVVLMTAAGVDLRATAAGAVLLLAVCLPAARLVAYRVEGKKHTFTVAGAMFVGLIAAPIIFSAINLLPRFGVNVHVPLLPALAAVGIGYAFGEGLGRLACLSFGCCYGKPLEECGPLARRLFRNRFLVFSGHTKKIAYEGNMAGRRVAPIQVVTSVVLTATAIAGSVLYLAGYPGAAFFTALLVTQAWRLFSETLRADYRGGGKVSAYQIMSVVGIGVALALAILLPAESRTVDLAAGIRALWSPTMILFLQGLWAVTFLYTGRSMVTEATLSFHVCKDRI